MGDKESGVSATSSIFKALKSPVTGKNGNGGDASIPSDSSRMSEALRLRQAMEKSSSQLSRKFLINELASPRREVKNQFADTDENEQFEEDEDFSVASFRGRSIFENFELNAEGRKSSRRIPMSGRLDVPSPKSKKSEHSVSSKVFKDQLSARFRSTTKQVRKISSTDSTEDNWGQ